VLSKRALAGPPRALCGSESCGSSVRYETHPTIAPRSVDVGARLAGDLPWLTWCSFYPPRETPTPDFKLRHYPHADFVLRYPGLMLNLLGWSRLSAAHGPLRLREV